MYFIQTTEYDEISEPTEFKITRRNFFVRHERALTGTKFFNFTVMSTGHTERYDTAIVDGKFKITPA